MTKNKKGKKRSSAASGGGGAGATVTWDGTDHVVRHERQLLKKAKRQEIITPKQQFREERRDRLTTKLTHDSREKRESSKLRLTITKTQRDIEKLRKRLQKWDDAEEKALAEKEEKERLAALQPKKKTGRLGPETWKLKGAARPAWQVCEFDVRYECPHQKAHDDARAKARRVRNLLAAYKGSFGQSQSDDLSYPHRRQFLALLMQYGLLNQEAKKYKTARQALLECLELDGVENPITDARCHLMRLYLQVNRPQSVHQLWTSRLSPDKEKSVWVLYSVALVEFVRWKLFDESTRAQAEEALARAIRGNVYCAYNLAWSDFFRQCMEYTDEIENASDDKPLEEAIEYCDSEQMGMWMGTDGSLEWLQTTILRALHGQDEGALTKADLEWSGQLQAMEKEIKAQREVETTTNDDNSDDDDDDDEEEEDEEKQESRDYSYYGNPEHHHGKVQDPDDDEEEVDTLMYAGMFRTTMEMLETNGSFAQAPPAIVEDDKAEEEAEEKEQEPEGEAQQGQKTGSQSEESDS